MDTLTPERRSWNMSRIRGKDTQPERTVRSLLHRMGYRFSLRRRDLPGKPDIVMPKHRTVIFVHGCFWHQHRNCADGKIPKSRHNYWVPKLQTNSGRDAAIKCTLKRAHWRVIVLWECQTKNTLVVERRLRNLLRDVRSAKRPTIRPKHP